MQSKKIVIIHAPNFKNPGYKTIFLNQNLKLKISLEDLDKNWFMRL